MMFGSVPGVASTLFLSIPSEVYRARVEDSLLREQFGEQWEDYAEKVDFFLPKMWRESMDR